jgi:hypothetical protein
MYANVDVYVNVYVYVCMYGCRYMKVFGGTRSVVVWHGLKAEAAVGTGTRVCGTEVGWNVAVSPGGQ